jgi:hypothetical protein
MYAALVDSWLEEACTRLAAAVEGNSEDYVLDQEEVDLILELAAIAAHESGERTNAPLLCYQVGLAHGRHGGTLAELVARTVGSS